LVAEDLHLPDLHPAAVALPLQTDFCPDQIALEGVGFALANGRCVAATLGPVALDVLLRWIFLKNLKSIRIPLASLARDVSNFSNGEIRKNIKKHLF